jgi:hypothetical protein
MRPAGLLFLVPAGFACLVAADAPATGLLSKDAKAHIRAGLPAFQPKPASDPTAEIDSSQPAPENNLLILPKLTVKERRLPPDAADHLMSPTAFKRKMSNLYLDELDRVGPLHSLLNRFTIPFLSPSRVERGKAIQLNRELDRLSGLMSPLEAKGLNDFYDQFAVTLGSGASSRR